MRDKTKLRMSEGTAGLKPPPGGQRERHPLRQWVVARRLNRPPRRRQLVKRVWSLKAYKEAAKFVSTRP